MKFYGYGYRKNCFGERMFFEDEMNCFGTETVKKVLSTAFSTMKKDTRFSFKACMENGECYAITEYNKEADTYTVIYSKAWNSTDNAVSMSKKAITAVIMEALKVEQNEHEI